MNVLDIMLLIFSLLLLVGVSVVSFYYNKREFEKSENIRMIMKDFMLKAKDSKSMLELCDVQKELNKYCEQFDLKCVRCWKTQVGYYIDGKVDGINLIEKQQGEKQ